MESVWQKIVYNVFQYAPCAIICLSFLPCGLVFGYTVSSFVAERNGHTGVIVYGPMILGASVGFVMALMMFMVKFFRSRIVFWHIDILLVAAVFHLISSCFYFTDNFDIVGAFISYLAHSLTFLSGVSFLHSICGKSSRAILLSLCFSFYLLGTSSAVSLINKNIKEDNAVNVVENTHGLYVKFAAVYVSIAVMLLALLIGLKILCYLGTVDCENSMDNEFRIANSNGSIFDKRDDVIKRIQFFYVTKNQQWNVTLLLIFLEAIQFSLFIYFAFWLSLNSAVRLTNDHKIDSIFWMIYAGTVISTLSLAFCSVKVLFVTYQMCLILLAILSMIICSSIKTNAPFWIILLFNGLAFSNLQILLVEVSHFLYMELLIYASYACKILSTSIVYYYFVSNTNNSYFYSTDLSTLVSQGFVYILIGSLMALIVGVKVPRTHNLSLFEIQFGLLGIIFQKHQIEQLNVRCLNDGTIPTISKPSLF